MQQDKYTDTLKKLENDELEVSIYVNKMAKQLYLLEFHRT